MTEFEVLQHTRRQVRLWPLDDAFRSPTVNFWKTEPEWLAVKHRYPVGSDVMAEITEIVPSNREYIFTFEGAWSVFE